jgi:uncharacterized membrane-anchored protein YitT (DUF2179 family)
MNPVFQQLIIDAVQSSKNKQSHKEEKNKPFNRFQKAKIYRQFKALIKKEIVNAFLMLIGILAAGFGLKGFLLPSNFIDGGVTGISLLVSEITGLNLPLLIILLNIPFVIIGYTQIGKMFALKTVGAIVGLALCLALVNYPVLTVDKLLVAAFGGFCLGLGIGLAMRGGGVMDGTEVMSIYLSKKTGLTVGEIILVFNIIIFSFAAWLLSFETALYSILTYLCASKTVDFILEGIEEHTGVTIISAKNQEIRQMITQDLGRGVTIYKGSRGYGKMGHSTTEIDILYTVITRLEVAKMTMEIEKIDPAAFVVMSKIKDTKGGMIKKKVLH